MTDKRPLRTIPKEEAVFRLDGEGRWHNRHGVFEHPRIIAFFHAAIRWDDKGFYLYQETGDYIEKVYFPYQDTALFVFDVEIKDTGMLRLNTGRRVPLEPSRLLLVKERLYQRLDDEAGDLVIKFTERSLMKLAGHLQETGNRFQLVLNRHHYPIPEYASLSDAPG